MALADAEAKANSAPDPPAGWVRHAIIATDGYGSFSMAYPRGWNGWVIGDDEDFIASLAEEQDLAWGRVNRAILGAENELGDNLATRRAQYIDAGSPELKVLTVTLTIQPDMVSDGLGSFLADSFVAVHGEVLAVDEYPLYV